MSTEKSTTATRVTVEAQVQAPVATVWKHWTSPESIKQWNHASDDWHTTEASVDLQVGGKFSSTMAAKDGSVSFDFAGVYTRVEQEKALEFELGDGRIICVTFTPSEDGNQTHVSETFDTEGTHTVEQQRSGWQAIMANFKKYVENL